MKRIVAHNSDWSHQFEEEAEFLAGFLTGVVTKIHHMGSTSVPNLPAKPIIDILMEVSSLDALDKSAATFATKGYEVRGEYGISGRRYFKKLQPKNRAAIHLHAYLAGTYQVKRHLAFRDYLRLKPNIVEEYIRIKTGLSDHNGTLTDSYQDAKKPFVDRISLEALSYFSKQT